MSTTDNILQLVTTVLDDLKAQNVKVLNVQGLTSIADYMVIASATSTRHVKALTDEVAEQAKKAGFPPIGSEGEQGSEWMLVDLGDVVLHVMQPAAREFYDLEKLWLNPDNNPAEKES